MAKRKSATGDQAVRQLIDVFLKLPTRAKVAVLVLALVAGVVWAYVSYSRRPDPGPPLPPGAKSVVLCVWNMENLFDDRDDRRRPGVDEDYDNWFAQDPASRNAKYSKLAGWLLKQNNGIGPDIIVGNEIESLRAAELLQQELNAGLPADAPRYNHVAMDEFDGGRHIAPCVISRYPLSGTRRLGSRFRILEVRVTANGHEMTLVASHWTSQVTQKADEREGGRYNYAAVILDSYAVAVRSNPKLDYLVCGDFNDTPDSDVVANALRLTADRALVTPAADPPRLFGPLSAKDPAQFATVNYGKPEIFDHVGLSPGMLDDEGWGYVADSVQVPTDGLIRQGTRVRRPWRFGSPRDDAVGRGYADHFPVVVTLKVAP